VFVLLCVIVNQLRKYCFSHTKTVPYIGELYAHAIAGVFVDNVLLTVVISVSLLMLLVNDAILYAIYIDKICALRYADW